MDASEKLSIHVMNGNLIGGDGEFFFLPLWPILRSASPSFFNQFSRLVFSSSLSAFYSPFPAGVQPHFLNGIVTDSACTLAIFFANIDFVLLLLSPMLFDLWHFSIELDEFNSMKKNWWCLKNQYNVRSTEDWTCSNNKKRCFLVTQRGRKEVKLS